MDLVSKQNGTISGFKNARLIGEGGGCVYVEAKRQFFDQRRAEHITSACIVNADTLSMKPYPVSHEDLLLIENVIIDKKNCVVTLHHEDSSSTKSIKLDNVEKIVVSDGVGSVSLCKSALLLTVIEKSEDKREYSEAKFRFKDPLGEGYGDLEGSIKLLLVDLERGSQEVLPLGANVMPLKGGVGANGDIYFLAINRDLPRNSGVIYCSNKPIGLYKYASGTVTAICTDKAYRSMVFSKDHSRLALLQCPLGGAHLQPSSLVVVECGDGRDEVRVKCEGLFVGSVFGMNMPEQRWTDWIYMTLQEGFYGKIVRIHLETGTIGLMSGINESWSIVGVLDNDTVLGQYSSVLTCPILGLFKDGSLVARQEVKSSVPGTTQLIRLHEHCEALLVVPESARPKEVIMMPHGGPNSNYVNEYLPFLACLLHAGYALCRINYTGSTGYDHASIDRLVKDGQVGVLDVADCMAVHAELARQGYDKIHVFGGSHGGYLAACLSSKYPGSFRKCIMLNPVITMYANCVSSDIFDYVYENMGLPFAHCPPTREQLELFHERSPCPTRDNPPTLVVVGGSDLRVPPFNGISWHGWLRALNVESDCLVFKDCNHSLSSPEADRNLQVATLEFLKK